MRWEGSLAPAFGVYAVRATLMDGDMPGPRYDGVANFGTRPMFEIPRPLLETYLFDFSGDLYGKHMAVELIAYLRPEARYDSLEAPEGADWQGYDGRPRGAGPCRERPAAAGDRHLAGRNLEPNGDCDMADSSEYTPPKVWTWDKESGGQFTGINRPTAGARTEKELPVGKHPFQLYSLATPNGVKVTVMFEELLAAGHKGAEYDAWLIKIMEGDQFTSGFVALNPNSKIPAMLDRSGPKPIRLFESGAMLLHLAEKFGAFLPTDPAKRTEALCWLFWQMGARPMSAAASAISMPMRRSRSNMPSTASPWRPSASSTCSTSASPTMNSWPATNIPSPISRPGPGMARS